MAANNKISVAEIVKHATSDDCWVVVNGKVYDLTTFAPDHPGGAQMVYQWAGKDGSETYNQYHSASLIETSLSPSDKKGTFDTSTTTKTWLEASKPETSAQPADPSALPPLSSLINLTDFEAAFAHAGSPKAWAYIHGASNDCLTLAANRTAWTKLRFRPRVLRDVAAVRTASRMLGTNVSMPVFICPMGIAKTAGAQGELALGAAAASTRILHCLSTTASYGVEDVLRSAEGYPWWYQLYVDRDMSKTLAKLALLNSLPQIKALVITVDLPVVSKREADERIKVPTSAETYSGAQSAPTGGLARSTGSFITPSLTLATLTFLRQHTSLPFIIKGIQSPSDAVLLHRHSKSLNIAGLIISNHGGRALDGALSSLEALLELHRDAPAVLRDLEVFVDGGVRRGEDVLKAVLLGARGVGVGRPMQCAVAYGAEGVKAAVEILRDELETAMRLCGITDLDAVRGRAAEWLNCVEVERGLPPPLGGVRGGGWREWLGLQRARL